MQVCFQRHESAYLGGDYFLSGDLQGEHFLLRRNRGLGPPDELAEPEFAEYGLLLEVNATSRSDLLKSALEAIPGLTLIRRRTLPDR